MGFGGLIGAGLAGVLRIQFPENFPDQFPVELVLLIGALLCAGLHHFGRPLFSTLGYYSSLVQLQFLVSSGAITKKKHRELIEKLTDQQFVPRSN